MLRELPVLWGVKIDRINRESLIHYGISHNNFDEKLYLFRIGHFVVNYNKDNSYQIWSSVLPSGYTEISFEDFERLVLNKKEIMSEVTLKLKTQPKRAKNITVGNEYTGIFVDDEDSQVDSFEEASYFRCVNNNGKEARYSIDLFEEPVEEIVKITMEQLINGIEVWHDKVISKVNGVEYEIDSDAGYGVLSVAGVNCSCGIYSVNGISALSEFIQISPDIEQHLVDYDGIELVTSVFEAIVKKVIDNTPARFLLFSTVTEYAAVCNSMDDICESLGGVFTQPAINPNSGNEIKAWLITKV